MPLPLKLQYVLPPKNTVYTWNLLVSRYTFFYVIHTSLNILYMTESGEAVKRASIVEPYTYYSKTG